MKTRHIYPRLAPYQVTAVDLPLIERTVQTANGAVKTVSEVEFGLRVLRDLTPADGIHPSWHYRDLV